jgi:hypothetical protein
VKKILVGLAAMAALIVVPVASASSLPTVNVTEMPGKVRVNSTFKIGAPQCVKDWYGDYPYPCTEADLVFRVWRKHADGWRRVYAESTWVFTNSWSSLWGSDITRIYNWEYRGYKYYGGVVKNRKHKVRVTLVDNFAGTANPTRTRYYWAKYRAAR